MLFYLDGQEPFYEIPIKNKEETYRAITELIRNGDFTTGNSLDYEYYCTHYKLIAIELSRQKVDLENQQRVDLENQQKIDLENQQINFIGKLEQDATIFFIIEQNQQIKLELSQNSLSIV